MGSTTKTKACCKHNEDKSPVRLQAADADGGGGAIQGKSLEVFAEGRSLYDRTLRGDRGDGQFFFTPSILTHAFSLKVSSARLIVIQNKGQVEFLTHNH